MQTGNRAQAAHRTIRALSRRRKGSYIEVGAPPTVRDVLGELDFSPQAVGLGAASLLDVGERLASVDFGLPLAQHVEVGPC